MCVCAYVRMCVCAYVGMCVDDNTCAGVQREHELLVGRVVAAMAHSVYMCVCMCVCVYMCVYVCMGVRASRGPCCC